MPSFSEGKINHNQGYYYLMTFSKGITFCKYFPLYFEGNNSIFFRQSFFPSNLRAFHTTVYIMDAGTYGDVETGPHQFLTNKLALFQSWMGGLAEYTHHIGLTPPNLFTFRWPCYISLWPHKALIKKPSAFQHPAMSCWRKLKSPNIWPESARWRPSSPARSN